MCLLIINHSKERKIVEYDIVIKLQFGSPVEWRGNNIQSLASPLL